MKTEPLVRVGTRLPHELMEKVRSAALFTGTKMERLFQDALAAHVERLEKKHGAFPVRRKKR